MPSGVRLHGPLDRPALRRALEALVRRHEALRTTYAEHAGEAVQVVRPPGPFPLPLVDLRGLPEPGREPEALRLAARETRHPFDLERGPVLRATLVWLNDEEHVVLFTLHHIAGDAWSLGVLEREVSAFYDAFSHGNEPALPPLPVQYPDYAAWQRAWLSGPELERQLDYWRDRLAGAPPVLELPTDHPRQALPTDRGAVANCDIPAAETGALRALAHREGATLFMVLLAAWQALLARYAGTDDVVVGTPVAGRTRVQTEGLIGFFANTLVLRTDLSGDPTVRELLARVRDVTLGAFAHQELPFEKLVEELAPERSMAHSPLFQVMIVVGNLKAEGTSLGGVSQEGFGAGVRTAKFDLSLQFADTWDRLSGGLEYRTELFGQGTAERMVDHLRALLHAMAADPEQRVSRIPLLSPEERARVLAGWNAMNGAAAPPSACVHHLFAAQAARTPGSVAVACGGDTLTYGELDARANRLARWLRARGVGPEARVGICLERRLELPAVLLAVLKAGAAYVPLDPGYPAGRLAWLAEDAGLSLVLTREELLGRVPATVCEVHPLERAWAEAADEAETDPGVAVSPQALAYVIYTSGSTGRPKGVAGHPPESPTTWPGRRRRTGWATDRRTRPLAARLRPDGHQPARPPGLGRARGAGRRRARASKGSPPRCGRAAARGWSSSPPRTWPCWSSSSLPSEAASAARTFVVGGEPLAPETVGRLAAAGAGDVDRQRVRPHGDGGGVLRTPVVPGDAAGAVVPIGRPIANTALYVLDRVGGVMPPGVAGELYIGGAGVARGYLGRPGLTAERFVPDPFAARPGARLYRTGDRVRGRADGSAGVPGPHRRPGEAARLPHRARRGRGGAQGRTPPWPAPPSSCARTRPATAAWSPTWSRRTGRMPRRRRYARTLKERLPDYMVPAAFVLLDALPLTPSGKVARRALPAPVALDEAAHVAPRTATEEILAGIYAGLLGRERVGAEDGFFDLGGHSLLATRLVSRVRAALGVELPLRAVFEAPAVAALAARVDELRHGGDGAPPAPPLVPVARDRPLPLSFAQARLWFLDRLEPGGSTYNMPYALRLRGALDARALARAFTALAVRHEVLRTTFAEMDGEPVQVVHPPAPVPLPRIDLAALGAEAAEAEARRLAAAEAARPFDFARGPLLRTTLLRLAADDHVAARLAPPRGHRRVEQRRAGARALRPVRGVRGRPTPRPSPASRAVRRLRRLAACLARGRGAGRPARVLEGAAGRRAAALGIPTDHPRRPGMQPRAGAVSLALDPEAARSLRELARREGATLFMVLLAAWQALLARYAGEDDVVVGTPIAGRTRLELEGLVGFFVNMLALRSGMDDDPGFAALVARVRETALGAYAHQDLPFERLVDALEIQRSLAHAPLFQATFALERAGGGEGDGSGSGNDLVLGDVRLEPFATGSGSARYDLSLTVYEHGGRLDAVLEYATSLYAPETAERMLRHLGVLLEAVAADPARPLSEVPLVTGAEREQVLAAGDAATTGFARDCVHDLFARQAARTPDNVAVRAGAGELTYRELDERSDRLARHLQTLGARADGLVGLCVERSLEMVVGILGILKSGAGYLPLDPAYPRERLAWMVEDSGVTIVVTTSHLAGRIVAAGTNVVRLDADAQAIVAQPGGAPEHGASPESLAYVIYTSGSTGTPKGVQDRHHAIPPPHAADCLGDGAASARSHMRGHLCYP